MAAGSVTVGYHSFPDGFTTFYSHTASTFRLPEVAKIGYFRYIGSLILAING